MTRVLAFTCSRYRPLFLRHCVLQFQKQTYPVDHAIYVNAPGNPPEEVYNYTDLLKDLEPTPPQKLFLGYGPSLTPHQNYLGALDFAPWETYDLFIRIDDDDIYLKNYVEKVVLDFEKNHWDLSGSFAQSQINGHRYSKDSRLTHLGLHPEDIELGVPGMMSGTFAFSPKTMHFLKAIPHIDPGQRNWWEDVLWRRLIAQQKDMTIHVRENSSYIYNIHGENVSTGKLLKKD